MPNKHSRVTSHNINSILDTIEQEDLGKPVAEIEEPVQENAILLINHGWNDHNEKRLIYIGTNSACLKWMHEKSCSMYGLVNKIMSFIVMFLLATLAIEAIFQNNVEWVNIYKKVIIFVTTIINTVQFFLRYEERSADHKNASVQFLKLYRDIQQKSGLLRRERGNATRYMAYILQQYDDLTMESPEVNSFINRQFKKTFSKSNVAMQDNIDAIQIVNESSELKHNTTNATNLTTIKDLNSCLQYNGDFNDKDISEMSNDKIRQLNKIYDKDKEYEMERFYQQDLPFKNPV